MTNPGPFEAKAPRARDLESSLGRVEEQRMRLQGSKCPGPQDVVGLGDSHWPGRRIRR
jgi:hypothetical protein